MRDIPADLPKVTESYRRARLGHVVAAEATVTVSNPLTGSIWEDVTIIGLLDEPAMMLERADGSRWLVPQSFRVDSIKPKEGK